MTPEELLKSKNINFKYSSSDLVVNCLSPEHEDKNPSMRIDKITGIFNCLSCGFSGSLFRYFNKEQNLLDIRIQNIKNKIKKLVKEKIYKPLTAINFEKEYRNISAETFKHFEAFTDNESKDLEGRIAFPIYDINDDIEFIHARYINSDIDPKYINLPANVEKTLYPIKVYEPNKGFIILVEGFFDMLNLWDKGIKNIACTFGSSLVGKKDIGNVKVINKFSQYKLQGINKLYILFDGDKAGRIGAKKLREALKNSYIIEILDLEEGKDPGKLSTKEIEIIRDYIYD